MADDPAPDEVPRLYANFPRRLNALSIDGLVLSTYAITLIALAMVSQDLPAIRIFAWAAFLLGVFLYDPVAVSLFGGTIGHHLMNLRVVDDTTGGNVTLSKALGRSLVKFVLGLLSFITMNLTKRHHAVHDLLTRSSVCIHDPSRAKPYHYTETPPK